MMAQIDEGAGRINPPPPTRLALGLIWLAALILAAGCAQAPAAPIETTHEITQPASSVLYVTPTPLPTRVPTAVRRQPTAASVAAASPAASPTAALDAAADLSCTAEQLEALYAAASDLCLHAPSGHFCSGGRAAVGASGSALSDALDAPGALVAAETISSLHSAPLNIAEAGGMVWLRLEESLLLNALLIGGIHLRSLDPADGSAAKWRSIAIESQSAPTVCDELPHVGALIMQSLYGQSVRVAINGASLTINGTLVVLTQDRTTRFIAIEGQLTVLVRGQSFHLNAGQQLNIDYPPADWTAPAAVPDEPVLLDYALIKQLPIVLFDRPILIPQPGFVQTQGGVNMRVGPDIQARLLFQVPAGETMNVLGISTNREWYHIRLGNGETGWMNAALLAQNLGAIEPVYDLTPPSPQRYGELAYRATVNASAGGNLRQAPDVAFAVKRTLPFGMELELLARSPYSPWVKVAAGDEVGWMALFTLKTKTVIASLPIDYNVPLPPRPTSTPSFSYGGGHAYPNPAGGF